VPKQPASPIGCPKSPLGGAIVITVKSAKRDGDADCDRAILVAILTCLPFPMSLDAAEHKAVL